jgi:hypothetical protein
MVRRLHPEVLMAVRGVSWSLLVVLLMAGCATGARARAPREPDSAAERLAALREATPELKAGALEERFAGEEDRQRREAERAARADRQHRIELMEKEKAAKKQAAPQ